MVEFDTMDRQLCCKNIVRRIQKTNEEILSHMEEDILLCGLAERTCKDYLMYARLFLYYAGWPA